MVTAEASPSEATCPDCGVRSTARHSNYLRCLKDLPVQGRPVRLMVRVARWRCRNPSCQRRIFCQRLNEVVHRHARETKRFGEILELVGHAMGGRPGERLGARLGLSASDDTLLRRVKRWARLRPPLQTHYGIGSGRLGIAERLWPLRNDSGGLEEAQSRRSAAGVQCRRI